MLEMLDVTIRIGMQCTDLFIFRFVSLLCLRCYIYIYIYIYIYLYTAAQAEQRYKSKYKKVGVLHANTDSILSNVSSIVPSSKRKTRRRANDGNVRLYYPYWQYTDLYIHTYIYIYIWIDIFIYSYPTYLIKSIYLKRCFLAERGIYNIREYVLFIKKT